MLTPMLPVAILPTLSGKTNRTLEEAVTVSIPTAFTAEPKDVMRPAMHVLHGAVHYLNAPDPHEFALVDALEVEFAVGEGADRRSCGRGRSRGRDSETPRRPR